MAVGLPMKTTYLDGDVWSASDANDITGTINQVGQTNNFYAGKNRIINGDFNINQRNFSSTTTTQTYGLDRWTYSTVGGTGTYSVQAFTLGTAPVSGYESANFARLVTSGQSAAGDLCALTQYIESVRTLAGQTATVSFWAKAASGTPKVTIELVQGFGSGGSPSSDVNNYVGQVTLSTSWARYTATITLPSISGKTLGTTANTNFLALNLWVSAGSNFNSRTNSLGIQNNTFDFWGVQVEAGSAATAFRTATGTVQGELAACQRYYFRNTATDLFSTFGQGRAQSTTASRQLVNLPVTMRIRPTSLDYSTLRLSDGGAGNYSVTALTIQTDTSHNQTMSLNATVASGLISGQNFYLYADNSTSAYVGFSAEL